MSTLTARFDLYAAIHKALRLMLTDTLVRVGSLDAADAGQRQAVITQLRKLLDLCRAHVHKEEHFVHPAMDARCPGLSARIAGEHVEHLAAIDALEARAVAFQCAPDAAAAQRLYRALALFVAENLEHMEVEESVHNAALWAAYSDAELLAVHEAILRDIAPAEMGEVLQWMLPAMSHDERLGMLAGLRDGAPAEAFAGALGVARQRLAAHDWNKLERDLDTQACAA